MSLIEREDYDGYTATAREEMAHSA